MQQEALNLDTHEDAARHRKAMAVGKGTKSAYGQREKDYHTFWAMYQEQKSREDTERIVKSEEPIMPAKVSKFLGYTMTQSKVRLFHLVILSTRPERSTENLAWGQHPSPRCHSGA